MGAVRVANYILHVERMKSANQVQKRRKRPEQYDGPRCITGGVDIPSPLGPLYNPDPGVWPLLFNSTVHSGGRWNVRTTPASAKAVGNAIEGTPFSSYKQRQKLSKGV